MSHPTRRTFLATGIALPGALVFAQDRDAVSRQAAPLDEDWKTFLGDPADNAAAAVAFDDSSWKAVRLPHNWEDYQGYTRQPHGNLHGTAWYRRAFSVESPLGARRYFLEMEGVGSYAAVWLNGTLVGRHDGGRTGFTLDLTDHLVFGRPNILAVRAHHPAMIQDLPYVCGGCWGSPNTEGSQPLGIFRPVRLVATHAVRTAPFGVHVFTPQISARRAVVQMETEVVNYGREAASVVVCSRIVDAAGTVLATLQSDAAPLAPGASQTFVQASAPLPHPHLWSPADPYLHRVRTVVMVDDRAADQVETRFGMRWIEWPIESDGEESSDEPRGIDRAKLEEAPSAANHFFTRHTGGAGNSQVRIQPVEVYIPSCTTEAAIVRVKTPVRNEDATAVRVRLSSFLRNFAGTKFLYSMETDADIAPGATYVFEQTFPTVRFPERWTPERPNLQVVESTVTLTTRAGKKGPAVLDVTETPFGIAPGAGLANRANAFVDRPARPSAARQSAQFLLNGEPCFINGTAEYEHLLGGDHAFTDEQITARLRQIKAAGFNALREAHHPHNLRYLALCDELGLLYWAQVGAHIYFDNEPFRENYRKAVREFVRERRNSPAVVLWGLQNESLLPLTFARELTAIVRGLDPTTSAQRKTTTCNGGVGADWNVPQNWLGTYGGNLDNYGTAVVQQKLVGEYGQWRTLGLHAEGDWHTVLSGKPVGRVVPEELFTYCLETRVRMAEENRDKFCGHFQWIFSSHANPGRAEDDCRDGLPPNNVGVVNYKGLLSSWGEPLDAFYMYRANYAPANREPMVYVCSHTWPDRFDGPGVRNGLVVYSNCEEVELFNDYRGASLGVRRCGRRGTHFQWDGVELRYDTLYAEARIGGRTVATDLIHLNNLPAAPNQTQRAAAQPDNTLPAPGRTYVHRVNCGGGNYTDVHGNLWNADREYRPRSWGSLSWAAGYPKLDPFFASQRRTDDPIFGTRDPELHRTFRYGRDKLRYRFSLAPGDYEVELYFIEPWYGTGGGMDCTGWRLFDVALNGRTVLRDLDIWKQAGHDSAFKQTLPVTVSADVLEISFPRVKSYQAVLSAIAIARR